jgi:hypothetical protein
LYFFIVNNWVGTSIVVIKGAIIERGQVMVRRRTASGSRWRRERAMARIVKTVVIKKRLERRKVYTKLA